MAAPLFQGSYVALITPFRGGAIDEDAFTRLVDWQIKEGSNGLVPVGTTGESPTLSHDEHKRVVELCIKETAGRVPVIAGAGSNCTAEAVDFVRHAKSVGADAALVVTPYYNKPTQEGLYQHFAAVAAVGLPIMIYNIPPRSIVDMSVETMTRLARLDMIVGVKDATASLPRVSHQRLAMGADFVQLSGEDATVLGYNAHGGHGAISVTCNVAPRLCSQFQTACLKSDYKTALALHDQLMPLHDAMFCEASPGPVKYAAWRLGLCEPDTRLPIVPICDASKAQVDLALDKTGLLQARAAE